MSQHNRPAPTTWDAYERGRASSFGSLESVPENEQQNVLSSSTPAAHPVPAIRRDDEEQGNLRRRSSFSKRLDSLRQIGGPNSIDNFAKSLQRAAGFREITPVRRNSITFSEPDQDTGQAPSIPEQSTIAPNRSLLRQQLRDYQFREQNSSGVLDDYIPHEPTEESALLPTESQQTLKSHSGSLIPGLLPHSELGSSYGSISARITPAARQRASILIAEQEEASRRVKEHQDDDGAEPPPQIEREVRSDGEIIERIIGESTVPMTIFNSTNVLIGVGILALPLGIRYSGWVIGLSFLTLAALGTSYTAKLLSKCLDTNTGSTTYGDIAFLAFDNWGETPSRRCSF